MSNLKSTQKNAGIALRSILEEKGVTILAAARKYNHSLREWHLAVSGIAPLDEILAKIKLIEESKSEISEVFNRPKGFPM